MDVPRGMHVSCCGPISTRLRVWFHSDVCVDSAAAEFRPEGYCQITRGAVARRFCRFLGSQGLGLVYAQWPRPPVELLVTVVGCMAIKSCGKCMSRNEKSAMQNYNHGKAHAK
jgi:hypothetical protein